MNPILKWVSVAVILATNTGLTRSSPNTEETQKGPFELLGKWNSPKNEIQKSPYGAAVPYPYHGVLPPVEFNMHLQPPAYPSDKLPFSPLPPVINQQRFPVGERTVPETKISITNSTLIIGHDIRPGILKRTQYFPKPAIKKAMPLRPIKLIPGATVQDRETNIVKTLRKEVS